MHYHLTEPQLLVGGFTVLLGLIFAVAVILEFRAEKHPPLGGFFRADFDRNLYAKIGFSQPEIPHADRQKVFADVDDYYLAPSRGQAETRNAIKTSRD